MSVFSLVNKRYKEIRVGNDDQSQFYLSAINSLTAEQKEIFFKECDIADDLEKKYGFLNVTDEMYEQAFVDAGLESLQT